MNTLNLCEKFDAMKVVYSEKQVADPGDAGPDFPKSPSAMKPKHVAEAIRSCPDVEIVEPRPLSIDDFKLVHDPAYVDQIMSLQTENGFGTRSQAIVDSLPYTNGAMYDALCLATQETPSCALVAGFHHAGYKGWKGLGYFCTFNGLMIAACKALRYGHKRIMILDCDMHHGNGTDDILKRKHELNTPIQHLSFGLYFSEPQDATAYLDWLGPGGVVEHLLKRYRTTTILYQAGADVHIDDPYGGVLTTEQIYERDRRVFSIAKELGLQIAWNLAGGYQVAQDGSIDKVIEIHLNTFRACREVFSASATPESTEPQQSQD